MILVAGSANLDFVVRAHHIPAPGETVLGRNFETFPGGKGANQAIACCRAGGATTHMLAAMGADAFSVPIETSLHQAHVQLHRVPSDQPTGTAFICVSDDAENAITVAPGANGSLQPQHLPDLKGFTYLLMQLEIPITTVTAFARTARQHGVAVVLNAAPMQPLPAELLDLIDILVVNEGELASLVGASATIAQGLERIAQIPTVVVTLGARGCCARSQGVFHLQAAFPVAPLDTTAAGDTFCGALVAAMSLGADLPHALARGSAAGALACTRMGAQSSIPLQTEVSHFLAQQSPAEAATMRDLRAYCGLPD